MIRTIEKCVCDFCGRESDDRLNLKRIAIYDSSITREPKANVDICLTCFEKMVKSMQPDIKERVVFEFDELRIRENKND